MCTVCEAPSARLPKSHVRTPASMEHGGCAPGACPSIRSIDHWRPPFVGSVSVRETPAAVPGPLFPTVIRNPIASPPSMSGASAVLVTNTSGQSTVIVALAVSPPSFVVVTPAVLSTTPQLAAVVDEMMCTDLLSLEPRSPKSQVSTPPAIEQSAESSLQTIPLGSVSVRVTPCAVPGPSLVTTIVNAAVSPASIVPLSAVLRTVTLGQLTVIDALAESEPSFVVVTFAVLSTEPQVAAVVGEVMCTCLLAPVARLPKLHVRTPLVIEQPESLPAASIDQFTPGSDGKVSVTVTPDAVPAPLLDAVIVYPIGSPAVTVASAGVFVMWIVGQFTVIVAVEVLSV